jgi:type IV fimbrial biogenesis protein FimT
MKRQNSGYTLIELMTAISILGILAAVAAPSWRDYTINSRSQQARVDLVTANSMARMAAITRGVPVSLCASANMTSCSGTAADWPRGWIVFTDNAGAAGAIDGTDVVLQTFSAPGPAVISLSTGQPTVGSGSWRFMRYMPTGEPQAAAQRQIAMNPVGCASGQLKRDLIQVSAIGAVRVRKVACP